MIDLRRFFPTIWPTDIELEDDEWERGPDVRKPESAVVGVYEVRPRPRWTNAEPHTAGLYFIRLGPDEPTRVADVYFDPIRGWCLEWSDIPARPLRGSGMQFSDRPIEEPRP